jgi:hypothetical protein
LTRTAAALAATAVLLASACARQPAPPVNANALGLPVFPGSSLESKSAVGTSSFALYRSSSGVEVVYRWYLLRFPQGTPHAYSAAKRQATFALFGKPYRRTIHLQPSGDGTSIMLTESSS